MSKSILIYSAENEALAQHICTNIGVSIERVAIEQSPNPVQKANEYQFPLLLITDDFLKSESCMNWAYSLLQDGGDKHIIPIVANGNKQSTTFERITNVIQYMNFWQDRYLEVRKNERSADNEHVNMVRKISQDIGEFLRQVREMTYYKYDEFIYNNYDIFYRITDTQKPFDANNSTHPFQHEIEQPVTAFVTEDVVNQIVTPVVANEIVEEKPNIIENETPIVVENINTIETTALSITSAINHGEDEELEALFADMPGLNLLKDKEVKTDIEPFREPNAEPIETVAASQIVHFDLSKNEIDEDIFFDKKDDSGSMKHLVLEIVEEEDNEDENELPTKDDIKKDDLNHFLFDEDENEDEDLEINDILAEVEKSKVEAALHNPQIEILENAEIIAPIVAHSEDVEIALPIEKQVAEIENITEIDALKPLLENKIEIENTVIEKSKETMPGSASYSFAMTQLQEGKVLEAYSVITNLCDQYPDNQHFRFQKALIETKYLHNIQLATENLSLILTQNPENADANFLLGEIAEMHRDHVTARSYYEKVANSNPYFPNIHYKIGLLINTYFSNEIDQAASYFKAAKKYSPDNADAFYQYAILQHEYLDKPEKAVKNLEKTLVLAPNHPFANYDLALIFHKMGNHYAALGHYESACQSNPEFKTPENDKAFSIKRILDHDRALEAINLHSIDDKVHEVAHNDYNPNLGNHASESEINLIENSNFIEHQPITDVEKNDLDEITIDDSPIDLENIEAVNVVDEVLLAAPIAAMATTIIEDIKETKPETIETAETIVDKEVVETTENEEVEAETETVHSIANLHINKPNENAKTVLITGATSGIGKATASIFAQNGFNLILCGRRKERLENDQRILVEQYGVNVEILNFDIQSYEACQHAIESLDNNWKNIDILVNNAGLAKGFDPIQSGNIEDWEEMIDTNLKGLLYVTRLVSPFMVARQSGHIINLCSTAGKEAYINGNVYVATKFAVDALTKSMRLDLHTHGIRVGQVAPGHVEENEFAITRFNGDAERAQKVYEGFQPLRSDDIARAIFYIVSQPDYVNIQDIVIMGSQQASATIVDRSGKDKYSK